MVRIILAWEGTLLAENVLQPLDGYEDLFQDEDSSWMYVGKVYGNHYFLNNVLRHGNFGPLVYNIGMLNQVPALKENGKTVLPVDLWREGRWTWSAFEDYLQKVDDYWSTRRSVEGNVEVVAYEPDYIYAALQAMHSNGASVYGDNGLEIDTPQAKEAVAYIERLMARGLIRVREISPDRAPEIAGLGGQWRFQWGESVFANIRQQLAPDMVGHFNDRGDTMGVVPFPRPDRMEPDDPDYRQFNEAMDSFAIPRGVSKEKADLAIRAFREYTVSFYQKMADSQRPLDYLQAEQPLRSSAIRMFLDITNEDYGDKILEAWKFLGSNENAKRNEYIRLVGIWDAWRYDILGDSLFQFNGASSYAVQVESKMPVINEIINSTQKSLNSTGVVDFVPPRFNDIEGSSMIFPVGTDPGEIDWSRFMSVTDNADGDMDFAGVAVDLSAVDFSRPGIYENAAAFAVSDNAGNEGTAQRPVIVFNGANTAAPTLTIRNGYRTVRLNENTGGINWRGDFVEAATDSDGLDIRDSIFADLSELNTTLAGTYSVTLFARDYAGNETSAEIAVTVE